MENQDIVASYRPEITGPTIPTFSIISGRKLREMYIVKKRETQIVTWLAASVVPSYVPKAQMDALLTQWNTEAKAIYPLDGNYRVRVLDEFGQRIPIGREVEFITDDEQVAVDPAAPQVPVCSDRVVVFQICNQNAITDDNFDIYLNDVYIGAVDLSANAQVGSVFIASTNPSLVITSADFACPTVGMQIYRFRSSLLKTSNVITMINTKNNGSGNAGTVGIRNYFLSGSNLSAPCVIADLNFSPANGESTTLNFNYTQCCP
jgi:hypothetical protein